MSRRTTLIRNKYLSHGRTIQDYIAGKSKTVFRRQAIEGGSALDALERFLAGKKNVRATSRPMSQRKRDQLTAYFSTKK